MSSLKSLFNRLLFSGRCRGIFIIRFEPEPRTQSNYDALLKEEAAIALAKLGDLETSLPVLLAQEHPSLKVSLTIVSVLDNETPLVIPALYNIVAESSDEREVQKAVEALIKIGRLEVLLFPPVLSWHSPIQTQCCIDPRGH